MSNSINNDRSLPHTIARTSLIPPTNSGQVESSKIFTINDFARDLDTLMGACRKNDHTHICDLAQQVVSAIDHMFLQKTKYFKNVWFTTRWNTYLAPIQQLKIELEEYLMLNLPTKEARNFSEDHTLKLEQMFDKLGKARACVDNEVKCQQSTFEWLVNGALDRFGETGQTLKQCFNQWTKPSSSFVLPRKVHTLIHLGRLITIYSKYDDSLINAAEKERTLAYALRHLDQTSTLFKGIETEVYANMPRGPLAEHLGALTEQISLFISSRLKKSTKMGHIRGHLETAVHDPRDDLRIAHWEAAAKRDTLEHLHCLAQEVQTPISHPWELAQRVDQALRFFEKNLEASDTEQALLQTVLDTALDWTELILKWRRDAQKTSRDAGLSERIGRIRYTLMRGNPTSALIELKKEVQNAVSLSGESGMSSLETIQELTESQKETLALLEEKTEDIKWQNDIKNQKVILINQMTYFTMFQAVCALTQIDHRRSLEAYTQIMHTVSRVPSDRQREVFLSEVKKQIDQHPDISTLYGHLIKSTLWILISITHFFAKNLISFGIESLIKTALVQARHPLNKAKLIPIEGITQCIIAHIKALKKWADDDLPLTKKELFATYLKDPKLNLGYEHDLLVEKVTKYVIAQFLKMEWSISKSQAFEKFKSFSAVSLPFYALFEECKNICTSLLWWITEKFILRIKLPHQIIDAVKAAIYDQSAYVHVIDTLLVDHLREVENALERSDQEGALDEALEGASYAKKIFREAVVHAFELLNYSQCDTAQELKQAMAATPQIIEPQKKLEEALVEAIVESLTIQYQSLFREKNTKELLLKMLQGANKALFPQTAIQRYYSEGEKAILKQKFGRELDDKALQNQRSYEPTGRLDIEHATRVKHRTKEQELKALTKRIIEKEVHRAAETLKNSSKTPCQQIVEAIDSLDDHLFRQNSPIKDADDRGTFIGQIEEGLRAVAHTKSESEKREVLKRVNRKALRFLKEYEKIQRSLDQVAKGEDQASVYAKRTSILLHREVMPHIMSFYRGLQELSLKSKNAVCLTKTRAALIALDYQVYASQAELENIREAAMRFDQQTSSEKVKSVAASAALAHVDTVEWYPRDVIERWTQGIFDFARSPATFESAMRHVVMLSCIKNAEGTITTP